MVMSGSVNIVTHESIKEPAESRRPKSGQFKNLKQILIKALDKGYVIMLS